ncbi:MAG: hypothetical protein HYV09_14240 [Deltaproteobacteria bacterium]|nr:hypothetical protein [Deltaproteobacteria bacterium]
MRAPLVFCVALLGCGFPEFRFAETGAPALDAASDDGDVAVEADADADAEVADARTDATSGDADATSDAPSDAALDAPKAGCAAFPTATFCADFDDVSSPSGGWTAAEITPSGSLTLESGAGRSLPNALLAATTPSSTATLVMAYVHRQLTAPAATTPMQLDAWFKLDQAVFPTTAGSTFLFKLERTGSDGDGVTLSLDRTGFFAERIGVSYERYPIMRAVKPGVWMHLRMDVVLHTTAGALTIYIDDMTKSVVAAAGVSTVKSDATARSVIVGLFSDRATSPFQARFDDVALWFR